MKEGEFWLEQAKRFVDAAKTILQHYHESAYYLALHAGELALKTVLVNCGIFSEEDETHNMLFLIKKIDNNECIPQDVLIQIKSIVEQPEQESHEVENQGSLSHTDIAYQDPADINRSVEIDCEAAMTSKIRYPIESVPPYEYINRLDAQRKVELSEKLMKVLEQYYSL